MKQEFKCQYCRKKTIFKLKSKEFEKIMSISGVEKIIPITRRTFICELCGRELSF